MFHNLFHVHINQTIKTRIEKAEGEKPEQGFLFTVGGETHQPGRTWSEAGLTARFTSIQALVEPTGTGRRPIGLAGFKPTLYNL